MHMVAQNLERREAEARVVGTSAPSVGHNMKEQSRFAQCMERMTRFASTYSRSDAERQAEMAENLPSDAISEEETKPTPNEAWTTTLKQPYQTCCGKVFLFYPSYVS